MRILLVHRYYAPDTPPYAHMLAAIGAGAVARGHSVRVLTCQPSYGGRDVGRAPAHEYVDGVEVFRFPVLRDRASITAKVVNLVWFALCLVWRARDFRQADVVMAATTPPIVIAGLCGRLARAGGSRFVYHKQDIWPEVSGSRGRIAGALKRLDRRTELLSDRVIVLSSDMAATVRRRGPGVEPAVLNNFDPWAYTEGPADGPDDNKLRLVFAGNLGRFQGVEYLREVIEECRDVPGLEWHVFGDGPMASELQGEAVTLYGHRSPAEVAAFIRDDADLGIVCLNRSVIEAAYPSKTMTYLRNGCPIFALVETDSDLARMVMDEGIGLVASQEDVEGAVQRLKEVAANPAAVRGSRGRAREVYLQRFSADLAVNRWCDMFEEVAS